MRLPEFLTELSPIRETLTAIGAGEETLSQAVAEKNKQVFVGTAGDEGLSLWEADYGLPKRSGGDETDRRADIRAAMAGGRTLTPAYLEELCVTLGGADRGGVTEDFANWRVTLEVVAEGRLPGDTAPLARAVERLKPAHLTVEMVPVGELPGGLSRVSALTGGTLAEVRGDDILRGGTRRTLGVTGGVLAEIRGR